MRIRISVTTEKPCKKNRPDGRFSCSYHRLLPLFSSTQQQSGGDTRYTARYQCGDREDQLLFVDPDPALGLFGLFGCLRLYGVIARGCLITLGHGELPLHENQPLEAVHKLPCGNGYGVLGISPVLHGHGGIVEVLNGVPAFRRIVGGVERIDRGYGSHFLSVASLSEEAGVSEVYFRREFKRCFGMTPTAYIKKVRMDNAKALLRTGYYPVSEVAERCGFETVSYFSSEFHRLTGMTPTEYVKAQET